MNYRTQPPWEFLLSASKNSLQSYELSRLSHAANLRKEITQLLDSWLEENTAAMLARWLMQQREISTAREHGSAERPETAQVSTGDERTSPHHARGNGAHTASDNFFSRSNKLGARFSHPFVNTSPEHGPKDRFSSRFPPATGGRRHSAKVCGHTWRDRSRQLATPSEPRATRTHAPSHTRNPRHRNNKPPSSASPPPRNRSVTSKQPYIY